MTHPIALVVDRSKINRWQATQILAVVEVFVLTLEPGAVVGALYPNDDPGGAYQIGWTVVVPEHTASKVREYFDQITAGIGA